MPKKLLITNVVYGQLYARIFLEHHLRSFLDESNIPAHADRVEYLIFSDAETIPYLTAHENFKRLAALIVVKVVPITWPAGTNRFDHRYGILIQTFRESVKAALACGMLLSALVADLVVAQGFLASVLKRIDEGHDSVFVLPLRAAYESAGPQLAQHEGALAPAELFKIGYENLHPLWVACHWQAAQFTKLPFSLLWNTGTGFLVRSYSITPVIFEPTEAMLTAGAVIDVEIPSMCRNPYWARDWTDAPVIGVEPLFCYYPTFANHTASVGWVREWAKCLHPAQSAYLRERLYYPDRKTVAAEESLREFTDDIIRGLT